MSFVEAMKKGFYAKGSVKQGAEVEGVSFFNKRNDPKIHFGERRLEQKSFTHSKIRTLDLNERILLYS
ncbi:hypothetical protein JOD43_004216 [Pullulanibacillus pueri]|uniref:Uncharacterized protein n=1 Tax=Pullulanibacillus pueri TaxID=1437324 RepID=A0A8J3EML3_9BACL|nr:hypothetical protein [Pullulanibacillus pueri]GGH85066.1 hypothetical protein GCM10007096_29590 [Pullulanibacillus pueri]